MSAPQPLTDLSTDDLAAFLAAQQAAYADLVASGLKLDLTRGKPASAQLDLADGLLGLPTGVVDAHGVDTRNYGGLEGIREIREMFAELLWVETEQVVAGGNSSLVMMREVLTDLMLKGGVDSERPWSAEEKVTFICPVPGYDRHFTLLEWFGIDTVTVPMNEDGPDTAAVAALVANDPSIKGIWIVPTYANPTGSVVTLEVAERLASMPTAAPDFKILWDNAYAFHHLTEDEAKSADILSLASAAGHPHRPIMFASTSKITYAGAGVAFLAGSVDTVRWYLGHLGKGAIGPDKLNQLRHAQFFGSPQGVRDHMVRQRAIIAPKFDEVDAILTRRLGGLGVATWTKPTGGYFVSVDVLDGLAARVVALAKEAGIVLTPAGASFPKGDDPRDRNVRLAPTFPELAEVTAATEGFATCVLLAAAEKLAG
ncbi:aminotransferase class I/II-fold pyridoxal phosphate-dependent enzyme [Nocardioides marmoriginsengisoli]|uniref:Aminotransferase class I/II-fold pyridoxal phosphate-dependent enzyme n=1 Tax=Nocardioides marmoriginsengisoli TaxID=661483 RepID=A0A3N0CCT7_9ACTN|nr:aminotransferase class I/II-fold pyridoxal phosphate-dependent enzyme [Nocardioides marmoriginsengisoli]RNL61119.1 aminotransferase class I/II-fold pyridoxal phosphate-dependent enzyme [Nocardioides marmoriginsengisoli]